MATPTDVLTRGLNGRRYAGVSALVSVRSDVVHRAVLGDAVGDLERGGNTGRDASVGGRIPLGEDALFDIASLTKVVGTTAALMALVTAGRVRVDDPLVRFVPSPDPSITLRHLLTHRAGLAEWQPLYLAADGPESAARLVSRLPLRHPVGEGRHYSDLGMILLGRVVEEVTGASLATALATLVTRPLGLEHTAYGPVVPSSAVACGHGDDVERAMIRDGDPYPVVLRATREPAWRSGFVRGEVSDGNAFHAMAGVSGHAGLFSTLDDVATLGAALLDESAIASRAVLDEFLAPGPDGQALGFWWREVRGGPAYVHSGFTGCRLLVDPRRRTVAVLLSNRLHVMEPGARVGPDVTPVWEAYLAATGVAASPVRRGVTQPR